MGETCEGPPSGNGDPRNASCVAADNFENKQSPAKKQRLSGIDLARRELLLDAVAEGCGDVIDYAESAERSVFHRDRLSLFVAVDRLIKKAIVVGEATADLRKLLGGQSTGGGR